MTTVASRGGYESSWKQQYQRLAAKFAGNLHEGRGVLVEVGCGRGQLTLPLAKLIPHWTVRTVDNFAGPYSAAHRSFITALSRQRLKHRIQVMVADYRQ